jgi:HK97 family phage portal protein
MGIFGLITKQERAELQKQIDALKAEQIKYQPWVLQTAEAEQWTMPDPSVYKNQADLFRSVSWVTSAVSITADTASLANLSVMSAEGEDEPEAIINHPFETRLRKPNPEDSRSEFIYATSAFWDLTGNAYWWMNRANANLPPDEIWVIPPHMIIPVPDGKMYLKGYLYTPGNGAQIFLEPHEICHFRRFNPVSRFVGLSAIESIGLVAQGDLGMQRWNTEYFAKNNARLPGILTFEQMIQDDQWRKIKDDTREASRNRELMLLRGTGAGGVKWLQNSISQKDMEFLSGRGFNKSEIYSVLAPGLEAMTDPNATEANANAGERTFMAKKIWPMLVRFAEKITASILPAYGENLIVEFDDVRISDRQLEMQEMTEYAKTHTVQEIREKYYQDKPLGDERDDLFIVQVNAQTGQPEPPAPVIMQPTDKPVDETNEPKPETIQGQEPLEDEDEADNNALKTDLDKWKRKALKKIGQAVPFESDIISPDLHAQIDASLPTCKSDSDVRALFVIEPVKVKGDILLLAEAINKAVEALDVKPA